MLTWILMAVVVVGNGPNRIGGSVRSDGYPLPGVILHLTGPSTDRHAVSDEEGRYEFAVRDAGSYRISTTLPGFHDETRTVEVLDDGKLQALDFELRMAPLIQTTTVTCVLPNFLMGTVTDESKRPVAGATAILRTKDSDVTATTDERGVFGFLFGPEDRSVYLLEVSRSGFATDVSTGVLPETGFNVEITLISAAERERQD